jgi:hypothetical protein
MRLLVALATNPPCPLWPADRHDAVDRAAVRLHVRFVYDSKHVGLGESLAVIALLAATPANRSAARRSQRGCAPPQGLSSGGRGLMDNRALADPVAIVSIVSSATVAIASHSSARPLSDVV